MAKMSFRSCDHCPFKLLNLNRQLTIEDLFRHELRKLLKVVPTLSIAKESLNAESLGSVSCNRRGSVRVYRVYLTRSDSCLYEGLLHGLVQAYAVRCRAEDVVSIRVLTVTCDFAIDARSPLESSL